MEYIGTDEKMLYVCVCACVCVCGVCAWCPVGYIPVLLRTLSENQLKPQSKLSPLFMLDDSI